MLHVSHFVSVKTLITLIKRSSPHSIVTKKMYKEISSVHGSSVLTVRDRLNDALSCDSLTIGGNAFQSLHVKNVKDRCINSRLKGTYVSGLNANIV